MPIPVHCPACLKPMGRLNPDGVLRAPCVSCSRHYSALYGRVAGRSTLCEPILYLAPDLPSFYKRHYELQLATPLGDLKALRFSISGKDDRLPIRRGDAVSILYESQGPVLERLIAINNHTTNRQYRLPAPAMSYPYFWFTRGMLLALLGVGLLASGANIMLAVCIWGFTGLIDLKVNHLAQIFKLPLRSDDRLNSYFLANQQLATQQLKIQQRVKELAYQCEDEKTLISRLQRLKQRMATFDSRLYEPRIHRIDQAIQLLVQQLQQAQRLIVNYSNTLEMIEIEIETFWLADQLPNGAEFLDLVLRRLNELNGVEEEIEALKHLLEANEEIRQLRC